MCNSCGNEPPAAVSAPRGSPAGKAANAEPDAKAAAAEQRLRADLKAAEARAQAAEEKLKEAGMEPQAADAGGASAWKPVDEQTSQQKALRDELKALKQLPQALYQRFGGPDGHAAAVAETQQRLDALAAAKREARPLADQISAKQSFVDQCSRSSAAAATKLDELHAEQAKLEKRVAEAQAASEAAEAKRAAAVSELAELHARRATSAGAPIARAASGGDAVVSLKPGSCEWEALSVFVHLATNPDVRQALLAAGMPPEQEACAVQAAATLRDAAAAAAGGVAHGHRPPDTAEAVSAMVGEAASLSAEFTHTRMAALEAEAAAYHNAIDMHMAVELDSDDESQAASEAAGAPGVDAGGAKRKADRASARAAVKAAREVRTRFCQKV